jgi:hypothetical protein
MMGAASAPALSRRDIDRLRHRGHAGGVILPHRALRTTRIDGWKLLQSAILTGGFVAAWLLVLFDWTTLAWARMLSFWSEAMGLGGSVVMVRYTFAGIYRFEAPYVAFSSALPSRGQLVFGAFAVAVVLVASFLVPKRLAPLLYGLRVLALTQATAEIFFYWMPEAFPYDGAGYVHGMLLAGLALLTIAPVMVALTYFIFDFSLTRKAALVLFVMVHLAVLLPLQYLAHGFVIHHGSLLTMPLVFLAFGLPLDVMVFIAFYGWAMSWKNGLNGHGR